MLAITFLSPSPTHTLSTSPLTSSRQHHQLALTVRDSLQSEFEEAKAVTLCALQLRILLTVLSSRIGLEKAGPDRYTELYKTRRANTHPS